MTEVKTAAIIGAGALGLMYAGLLHSRLGEGFFFLADGNRLQRLKQEEYNINGKKMRFPARGPEELDGACDLVIVSVKNNHLEEIPALLKNVVSENTCILSVLNGIDSEEFLEQKFPKAEVIYTVALGMDAVKEGKELRYSSIGKLLLGIKNNMPPGSGLKKVTGLLDSCGLEYELPDDIHRSIWWKWMINIGVNQVSAVTGAKYGTFHSDENLRKLMDSAMYETIRVAKACGIDLRNDDVKNWYPVLYSLGAEGKTSMLQDIEAERLTEAPWFGGRLIELAQRHCVDVPVNETLYRIIRTKELLYSDK